MRLIPCFRLLRLALASAVLTGTVFVCASAPLQAQVTDPDAGQGAVVDSVRVEGNRWIEDGVVLGTIQIQPGTFVNPRDIQEAERRLWSTGRFQDIQVFASGGETDEDPVVLTFQVEERPTVRELRVEGLSRLSAREVREEVEFEAGLNYSPQLTAEAIHFIRTELASRGIPFAQVEERLDPVTEDGSEVDLVLDVSEGTRVTVAEMRFEGNDAFDDSELKKVLSTREEGFLWFRSGEYREEDLETDLAVNLPEFYASHGYLDFSVRGDTLVVDPSTGKARVEVAVEEGPQYRLAEFEVSGNRHFPSDELEQYYTAEQGGLLRALGIGGRGDEGPRIFDRKAFLDAIQLVQQQYRNEGYLYAQVEPIIERNPARDGESFPTVSARWQIDEGLPAYVNRVIIQGNTYTHDRIIREQLVVLPGDVYSEERVIRSYQAIQGLGFFESPGPLPDIRPDQATGDVDVVFEVEEKQTGSVNFGTTMGGAYGVSGFIGYEQPNLFGQAKSGSLRWDFGTYQNNFHVQYTDPTLFQSRVSGTISLFDSRDRFFSFATGERKRRGGTIQFGLPLPGARYTRLNTGYSLSYTDYRLREGADDESLFGRPPGTQSQVSLGLTRRTLNHPVFPSIGSSLSFSNQFNGGILGGDGSFTKHEVRGEWWVPIAELGGGTPGSRPITTSLGLKARAGTLFGNADRFPFDRFWLGGVQFGEQLRGYEETTITPEGYFPRGSRGIRDIDRLGDTFLRIGAEYAIRLHESVSISAFYEAGNVWRDAREVDPSRLFRGAGLGVMLVTPFGPIGIDYAYGFDKTVPGWQFHFRMGGQGVQF